MTEKRPTMGNVDMEKFITGIHEYFMKAFKPLVERLETLERKMEEVEQRGLDYKGTFREGTEYTKGDVLTHQGSIWIATRKTIDKPPGNGWLLSVKSAR